MIRSFLFATTTCIAVLATSSASEEFLVVGEGYQKNLDSFPHFTCKFTVNGGNATSLSDVFEEKNITGRGRDLYAVWIVKGPFERFYLTPDNSKPLGMAFDKTENRLTENYTTDGKLVFHVDLTSPGAVLNYMEGNERHLSTIGTPFNYGRGYSVALLASLHARKKLHAEFVGGQEVFGTETLAFKTGKSKDEIFQVLYIDPERGFFPRKCEHWDLETKQLDGIGLVTHLKEYSKARWFPMRAVSVWNPLKAANTPYAFREFKVTHFDPDSPIPDEAFSIHIPKGYSITLEKDQFALVRTVKDRTYQIADLPPLLKELKQSAKKWMEIAEARQGKVAGNEGTRWIRLALFPSAVGLGLFAGLYLVKRRRRTGAGKSSAS